MDGGKDDGGSLGSGPSTVDSRTDDGASTKEGTRQRGQSGTMEARGGMKL